MGVPGLPMFIALGSALGPVVDSRPETAAASVAHGNSILFATPLRDGCYATKQSQGAVFSVLERLPRLGEHRGAHQLPHARQGLEESCVTMLSFSLVRHGELLEQSLDVAFDLDLLLMSKAQPRNE